jgi:hypothetical protein
VTSETPRLCKYLRAKTHGVHGDPRALQALRTDASAIFWCLLTMSPAGPDDRLAHVCDCGDQRACCVTADPEGVT